MITNKRVWVEYTRHLEGWTDFCDLCMEYGVEVTFCCFEDDPRINME